NARRDDVHARHEQRARQQRADRGRDRDGDQSKRQPGQQGDHGGELGRVAPGRGAAYCPEIGAKPAACAVCATRCVCVGPIAINNAANSSSFSAIPQSGAAIASPSTTTTEPTTSATLAACKRV